MNPIQQAIEALESCRIIATPSGRDLSPRLVKEALTSLRSLQKEVEGVAASVCRAIAELPDRNSPADWPEAMLVTHDELAEAVRTAVAAALGRGAVPQDDGGWLPFDYGNPPDDGLMFVAVSAPETDCDVDDYGRTVGWHTGEVEHSVCMVLFSAGDGGEHDFHPVAEWETGKVPADGVVTHYAPVRLPAIPKEVAAPSPEATQQAVQAEPPNGWRDTVRAALHLLNDTQNTLGRFLENHRNPSEKDTVNTLLGLHDTNAALRTRRELSDLLAAPPAPGQVERDGEDAGAIAYQLTKRLVIDIPTARAAVDAAIRAARSSEGGGNEHSR